MSALQATSPKFYVWSKADFKQPPVLVDTCGTRSEAQGVLDAYRQQHLTYDAWITEKPLAATRS